MESEQISPGLPGLLWSLTRAAPLAYLVAALLTLVLFLVGRIVPGLVLQRVYDGLSQTTATVDLAGLLALYIGVEVARFSAHFSAGFARSTYQISAQTLLTKNVQAALFAQPGASPLPLQPGDAVNRLDDDVRSLAAFPLLIPEVIGQAIAFIVAFAILLRVNVRLTLFVVVPLLLIVLATSILQRRLQRRYEARRDAAGAVTAFLGEIFAAVQAVKVASAEDDVIRHLARLSVRRRRAAVGFRLLEDTLSWLGGSLADVGIGLVLLLSSQAIGEGTFTVGDFVLFITYLWFMVRFPTVVGRLLSGFRAQEVARDRLITLAGTTNARALVQPVVIGVRGSEPEPAPKALTTFESLDTLTVRRLSYHYPGTTRGISDVSLQLKAGTVTIITGRVGSGKTTLLRVLLGLLPRDGGTIWWNGKRVANPASFLVPPRAAYTPQVPHLVSVSLRDNILLGLSEENVDLAAALRAAVLEQDVARLADGLDTIVGPRGVRLSGGQVQRTAAARMFVRRPALLVFDDLSSALDVETEAVLWHRLRAAADGAERVTILAVAHRSLALQHADQVIVLRDGLVTYAGPPAHNA